MKQPAGVSLLVKQLAMAANSQPAQTPRFSLHKTAVLHVSGKTIDIAVENGTK